MALLVSTPALAQEPDASRVASRIGGPREIVEQQFEELLNGQWPRQAACVDYFWSRGAVEVLAAALPRLRHQAKHYVVERIRSIEQPNVVVIDALIREMESACKELEGDGSGELSDERRCGLLGQSTANMSALCVMMNLKFSAEAPTPERIREYVTIAREALRDFQHDSKKLQDTQQRAEQRGRKKPNQAGQ